MTYTETDPDSLAATHDTAPEDALADAVSRLPDTHPVTFTMKMRGGAYDRLEVDKFMGGPLPGDRRRAGGRARRRKRSSPHCGPRTPSFARPAPTPSEEITAGAVGLLTQAQLIADKAVADAERYARDLVLTARNQYREILERAESSAGQATATLPAQHSPAVPEIEYVRTYAQVAQIQLRSVLEALTEQVDRLGSLPQAAAEPVEQPDPDDGPTGEPDWEPSTSGPPTTQPR